jgi:L-lactate dehydrogenase complex protein LldE
MRIGLFVPCYVDAFHPEVGIATLEIPLSTPSFRIR